MPNAVSSDVSKTIPCYFSRAAKIMRSACLYVCLGVCLSVWYLSMWFLRYANGHLKKHVAKFHEIFCTCYIAMARSVLFWRQRNAFCASSFADDVVIQFYTNNATNLHHLTTHSTTVLPLKMAIVLRPKICDVTSPYVFPFACFSWIVYGGSDSHATRGAMWIRVVLYCIVL